MLPPLSISINSFRSGSSNVSATEANEASTLSCLWLVSTETLHKCWAIHTSLSKVSLSTRTLLATDITELSSLKPGESLSIFISSASSVAAFDFGHISSPSLPPRCCLIPALSTKSWSQFSQAKRAPRWTRSSCVLRSSVLANPVWLLGHLGHLSRLRVRRCRVMRFDSISLSHISHFLVILRRALVAGTLLG